jgi:isopenicillin N synthase-like dioxygenase
MFGSGMNLWALQLACMLMSLTARNSSKYVQCICTVSLSLPNQSCTETTEQVARFEVNTQGPLRLGFASDYRNLFQRFTNSAYFTLMTILERLSDTCKLAGDDCLEYFHRDDRPSCSSLALFHYPKQSDVDNGAGHNKHTDLGTLTFQLCEQWGLQVLMSNEQGNQGKGDWAYVPPKPGHAVINVGDSLRFLSHMKFRSAVHRVVNVDDQPPKISPSASTKLKQGLDRYSIAYFLRPEDDVTYRDSLGRIFSAREWHDTKFNVFCQGHDAQEDGSSLTRGIEKAGVFVDLY